MSTADAQERLKAEAKTIRTRIETLIKDKDQKTRMVRTVCIYAGMLTETLMEYEEPDVVMEQAFFRIADLLKAEPCEDEQDKALRPYAYAVDHDADLGRLISRNGAKNVPKGLDDMHEIAIAMVISDFPIWEGQGFGRDRLMRLLIESVISALTYEMATQDFCDMMIDDFMASGHTTLETVLALGAATGFYFSAADRVLKLPEDARVHVGNVMVRESLRHGTPGSKDWSALAASNDADDKNIPGFLKEIRPKIEEFFELIGLDDLLGRSVALAKSVGRIVSVISVEDVGHIHPSVAKSVAKTGMILGMNYSES